MIEELIEMISKKASNRIVTTDKIYKKLENYLGKFDVEIFNDLRSAAFFALGNSSLDEKGTIILLEGEYLPNIYTAVTECWFQRKQIIVIALYDKYDNIKCEYLRRCMPNIINIYEENIKIYQEDINSALTQRFPCLLNVVTKINDIHENKINYNVILKKFETFLDKEKEVFIYNALKGESTYNFKINNIEEKHKYGILSKYVGYVTAKNQKVILCAPSKILKTDLNIFNNRYTNSNIKIILLESNENEEPISNWIEENKISVKFVKDLTEEELKEFYNSDKAEIIFYGGIE